MAHGMVTVRGRYLDQNDLTPAKGSLTFTLGQPVRVVDVPAPRMVVPSPVTVSLDDAGAFSASLLAVDDDADNPGGSWYQVYEVIAARPRSYVLTLTPSVTDVDMADVSEP